MVIASSGDNASASFASLIKIIKPHRLSSHASLVRFGAVEPDDNKNIACEVGVPPLNGAFDLVYRLDFVDGVSWTMRIPLCSKDGTDNQSQKRSLVSEAGVMQFLRQHTSIPIPQIFAFDESTTSPIGDPYILMKFAPGMSV